jgi:ATP-binding cassette subfamily C (CFTR/MRP) protein 1
MQDRIEKCTLQLDTPLRDIVWSAGEAQLLSIARALLRPGHVLLCDEATAHVDSATDSVIHEILMRLPRTVLSICHRLDHLMAYDVVLVLDKGELVQYGPPAAIMADSAGLLASLINTVA